MLKQGIIPIRCIHNLVLWNFQILIPDCPFRVPICQSKRSRFLHFLFQRNSEYHNHETISADHFHIPAVKSDLGKTGIRFRRAIIRNAVLSNNVNTDVSDAVYVKFLKRLINENVLPWINGKIIILYLESTQPCNHHFEQICWSHSDEYFIS